MDYEFNHELDIIESGNLKEDIYMAVKLELSDYFHAKYKIYLDEFCDEENILIAKFYSEYYQLLNRLSIIAKNKTIKTFREYAYSFRSGLFDDKNSELNTLLTTLREIDDLIISFSYDIMKSVKDGGIQYKTSAGVFSIIKQYFKTEKNRRYEGFENLLEALYDITYRAMRLKYKENKYGKK